MVVYISTLPFKMWTSMYVHCTLMLGSHYHYAACKKSHLII